MSNRIKTTRFIAYTGVLSAVSAVLMFLAVPLPVSGLKIDASDIPAAIAGVIMGPAAAVAVELLKVLIHILIQGLSGMGFGDIMNFVVGVALAAPFSAVYRTLSKRETKRYITMIVAGIAGMIVMVVVGVIGNYFIVPLYYSFCLPNSKLTDVMLWAYIGGATILNVAKAVLVGALMYPLTGVIKKRNIGL